MNRQDIANLAFKVVGLYCIIQAIPIAGWMVDFALRSALGQLGGPQAEGIEWLLAVSALIGPALLGVLGVFLLVKSRKLAERVFPEAESQSQPARILAIHALTFSVVGLFIIAGSLPQVLGAVVSFAFTWKGMIQLDAHQLTRVVVEPLVKLTIGVCLFFGSHRLVRVWSRLRYAGIREKLGLCTACGYDLTGNTSGVCPECGTAKPEASAERGS